MISHVLYIPFDLRKEQKKHATVNDTYFCDYLIRNVDAFMGPLAQVNYRTYQQLLGVVIPSKYLSLNYFVIDEHQSLRYAMPESNARRSFQYTFSPTQEMWCAKTMADFIKTTMSIHESKNFCLGIISDSYIRQFEAAVQAAGRTPLSTVELDQKIAELQGTRPAQPPPLPRPVTF